ncbi:hypothetical protein OK016_25425 [Vibrio chagasii]|nr:hypothetical protein [Vibrio chagasii]
MLIGVINPTVGTLNNTLLNIQVFTRITKQHHTKPSQAACRYLAKQHCRRDSMLGTKTWRNAEADATR